MAQLIPFAGTVYPTCGPASDGTKLAEIFTIIGTISDTQMYKAEGYLAWKFGLQTNLASGHTYKTARPMFTLASY